MKKYILPLIISVLLAACGKSAPATQYLTVKNSFTLDHMTNSNAAACIKVNNGLLYYVQLFSDKFTVKAVDLQGNEQLTIDLPHGKGPGEALHSMSLTVTDEEIMFSDFALRRISRFNKECKMIDSVELNTETGQILHFDIMDGNLFYTNMGETYLGRYELDSGKITATVPRKKEDMFDRNKPLKFPRVITDPRRGDVYSTYMGKPYRIERYSPDLELKTVYKYKLEKEYIPLRLYSPGYTIAGDFTATSVAADETHVYAPHIGSRAHWENNEYVLKPFTPEIMSFNKTTGEFVGIYRIKGVATATDDFTLLYADETMFIVQIVGTGAQLKACGIDVVNNEDQKFNMILVLER